MLERLKRAGPAVTTSSELAARYQCHKDYMQLHSKFRRRDHDLAKPPTPPRVRPPRRSFQPWRKAMLPPLRASKKSEVTNFSGEAGTDKASEKGAGILRLEDLAPEPECEKDDALAGALPGDVHSAAEGPDASALKATPAGDTASPGQEVAAAGHKESCGEGAAAAVGAKDDAGDYDDDEYGDDDEEFDDDFDDDEEAAGSDASGDDATSSPDSPRMDDDASPAVGEDGRLEGASRDSLGDDGAEGDAEEQPQDDLPAADAQAEASAQAEPDAGAEPTVEQGRS